MGRASPLLGARTAAFAALLAALVAYYYARTSLAGLRLWWDIAFLAGVLMPAVFLLKHRPQSSEAQEGVAFYGRTGQAILKSLQRLRVDPMAVYGTNCLKFEDGDEDESRPWLQRELRIVQPKLLVLMGEEALAYMNSLEFPLADPLEYRVGDLQRFTATIEALVCPDIDASLDEQPAKTRFWNAFKRLGPWWAELPPY